MSTKARQRRKRYGGTRGTLESLVGSTPRNVGPELACTVHTPHWRDFKPLLRPDGPFYGSGG